MIDIYMSGMCENCKHADLELETIYFDSSEGEIKRYELKCSHEEVCRLWEMKLRSEHIRVKYEAIDSDTVVSKEIVEKLRNSEKRK